MSFLADTHVLVWAAQSPERINAATRDLLSDPGADIRFSVVSIWEYAIKHQRRPDQFVADPATFREGLLAHGFREIDVTGSHAQAVTGLPPIHHDPFDRMLVAQAQCEQLVLLTGDENILRYSAPIWWV
jgi:PIN domain nuclease of toxin-antitoxin system